MSWDIILVNHKKGRTQRLKLDWHQFHIWSPIVAVFTLMLAISFWVGQQTSAGPSIVVPDSLGRSWQSKLSDQRHEINDIREQLQHNMQALYQRLGQMQANVTRLNAVGQRVSEMARIKPGEFNFDEEPALGGPEFPLNEQGDQSIAKLEAELNQFENELDARERELRVLQDLVVAGRLREQIYPSGRPVLSGYMTSTYGRRSDPFSGRSAFHKGIDFANKMGSPVVSVAAGVVTRVGRRNGYGIVVEITHGNGYLTRYGHNSRVTVKVGDRVSRGQEIAKMGSTGRSTGPHVHFEVEYNGVIVNPAEYIRAATRS